MQVELPASLSLPGQQHNWLLIAIRQNTGALIEITTVKYAKVILNIPESVSL